MKEIKMDILPGYFRGEYGMNFTQFTQDAGVLDFRKIIIF